MARFLRKGDRIRLKVRTALGWKGDAVVVEHQLSPGSIIVWRRSNDDPEGPPGIAMRHEVVLKAHK